MKPAQHVAALAASQDAERLRLAAQASGVAVFDWIAPDDLIVMNDLRRVFDPAGHANPNKVLPQPGGCVEVAAPRRQAPL